MIILIIIYIISVIGAVLTVRYDSYFDEESYVLVVVFCPVVNLCLSILELFLQLSLLFDIITQWDLDEKFYKLIKLGRK